MGPTWKACRDAHSPMYLGSRGTETVLGNTSQPGEEALMTTGQAQIQVVTASTTKAALRR